MPTNRVPHVIGCPCEACVSQPDAVREQLAMRAASLEALCERQREWGRKITEDNFALCAALEDMLARFAPSDDGLGKAEIACAARARAVLGGAK